MVTDPPACLFHNVQQDGIGYRKDKSLLARFVHGRRKDSVLKMSLQNHF